MNNNEAVLRAMADDTRLELVKLLLRRKHCVGALAKRLGLTEAAVSQHLKVLREAGLISGEKHGYFMHYEVDRDALRALAAYVEELASIQSEPCVPEDEGCVKKHHNACRARKDDENRVLEVRQAGHGGVAAGEGRGHGRCRNHVNSGGHKA